MFRLITRQCVLCIVAVMLALAAGCSKDAKAPDPLTVDQMPAALTQAFQNAPADQKEVVEHVVKGMETKAYGKALMAVETLCAIPELTPEQREIASQALLTVNAEFQAAVERGDKAAIEFKRLRHSR
jgi:hypothetical protein